MTSDNTVEQVTLLKRDIYEDREESEVESFDSEDGYWHDEDGRDNVSSRRSRCSGEIKFLVVMSAFLVACIVIFTLRTGTPNIETMPSTTKGDDGDGTDLINTSDDGRPVFDGVSPNDDDGDANRTAIWEVRHQLAVVVQQMQLELYGDDHDESAQMNSATKIDTEDAPLHYLPKAYEPEFLDLSNLFEVVSTAIDSVGVFGLYFQVFTDGEMNSLNWFWSDEQRQQTKEDRKMCWTTHGMYDCDTNTPWWFYHYIGAATANKIMQEGSVLWRDRLIVDDVATLIHLIHTEKDRLRETAGDMSYHAEHGILWTVIPLLDQNMTKYPFDLAEEYCGDYYGFHNVRGIKAAHTVGRECYHGIGHAVFMAVARKQLGLSNSTATHVVLRPESGFEFTTESWCLVKNICESSRKLPQFSQHSTEVDERCFGGVRHSVHIFVSDEDTRWKLDTEKDDQFSFFQQKMWHCQ
jgi:hypothetical protein